MAQKNNTARIMIGIVVGILLFTMSLSSASAATITVNATGVGADYLSIQAAINNANTNDIIEVQSGTYLENVVVNKTLSLKGFGMPLVNASGSGTAITVTSGGSMIDGFNVTGSGTDWNGGDADSGIKIKSDGNSILNSSAGFNNYGIYVFESVDNIFKNNTVSNNTEGFYLLNSNNNLFLLNTIGNNTNYGLCLSNSDNSTITNNHISNNVNGFFMHYSNNNTLKDNNVIDNNHGFYLYRSANNVLTYNDVLSNYLDGFHLYHSNNNTLTNNNATTRSTSEETPVEGGFGAFYIQWSDNVTLDNNTAIGTTYGFNIRYSNHNNLRNNTAHQNTNSGFRFDSSGDNTLVNNIASGNKRHGYILYFSGHFNRWIPSEYRLTTSNTLINNTAINNGNHGFILEFSGGNSLISNTAINNSNGFSLDRSGRNTLTNNNASENVYGVNIFRMAYTTSLSMNSIGIVQTSGNSVLNILSKNNLINNTQYNAYDAVGLNTWASNYYGDYEGTDSNSDNIGDTSYYLAGDSGAKDKSPSMQSYDTSETQFSESLPPENTYIMSLKSGWNFVSIPIIPHTPDVDTIFGNGNVVFPIYSWNADSKQYYEASTIDIGNGYWILTSNDIQITIVGSPYSG